MTIFSTTFLGVVHPYSVPKIAAIKITDPIYSNHGHVTCTNLYHPTCFFCDSIFSPPVIYIKCRKTHRSLVCGMQGTILGF